MSLIEKSPADLPEIAAYGKDSRSARPGGARRPAKAPSVGILLAIGYAVAMLLILAVLVIS